MLIKILNNLSKDVLKRSSNYFEIGRDIFTFGKERIMGEREIKQNLYEKISGSKSVEKKKKNSERQMINKEGEEEALKRQQESMKDSQGIADHIDSSYHGPGKSGEKSNPNMWQRNFENHQGN